MPTPERQSDVIEFCRGLAERGLLVPAWPSRYGGRDISAWAQVVLSEEMRGVAEPRGPQYMNVNWIGPAIMELGTEEQKQAYTGPIAAGEAMWCQGFSEPDAGSDLSALRTAAVRDGDVYIVMVTRSTSYAHAADYCFTLVLYGPHREPPARHLDPADPDAPRGRRGSRDPHARRGGTWSTRSSSATLPCRSMPPGRGTRAGRSSGRCW